MEEESAHFIGQTACEHEKYSKMLTPMLAVAWSRNRKLFESEVKSNIYINCKL